jgi:FixJ family two-component response regulator
MNNRDFVVFIVDDDVRMCEALCELCASRNVSSLAFGSVDEYLACPRPDLPACLVLDVRLPGLSGLEFQQQLGDAYHPPIVFLTGHGDIPSSVRAIKAGAIDFLTKPFAPSALFDAIAAAVATDRRTRREDAARASLMRRYSRLTPREREVLPLVVSGLLNKQAAAELGISEVTLEIHRRRVMQKMEARSLADLVRMAEHLRPTSRTEAHADADVDRAQHGNGFPE